MCEAYEQDTQHFKYCVWKDQYDYDEDIKYFKERGRHIIINLVDNRVNTICGTIKNEIKKLPFKFCGKPKSYIII